VWPGRRESHPTRAAAFSFEAEASRGTRPRRSPPAIGAIGTIVAVIAIAVMPRAVMPVVAVPMMAPPVAMPPMMPVMVAVMVPIVMTMPIMVPVVVPVVVTSHPYPTDLRGESTLGPDGAGAVDADRCGLCRRGDVQPHHDEDAEDGFTQGHHREFSTPPRVEPRSENGEFGRQLQ
jgi:hypothetical protein